MSTKSTVSSMASRSGQPSNAGPLPSPRQSRKNRSPGSVLWGVAALCGPLLATGSQAADASAPASATPPASLTFQKPIWLTDFSLSLKEGYDDNVYQSGVDKKFLPATYTLPAGSVAALRDVDSFVTTVSPKVGVNFAPLLGDQTFFQTLSLGYAPDFVTYHAASSEDYNIHRIPVVIKAKTDDFTFNIDNAFNYVNGSKVGQLYPGNYFNVYSISALRERREQYQDKNATTLQYDQDHWFARAVGSLAYYDLRTAQLSTKTYPGYMNYASRYDLNGGGDFGYKISPDAAVTVGYRFGHQYQQKFPTAVDAYQFSSSSDYQRALLGFEGKPWSWLTAKIQGGPDFRHYANSALVADRNPVKYFGEASLTATITPDDTVTFKYRQFQWVSSIGKGPYFDSSYELNYARKLTSKLSLSAGGRIQSSDYTSGETTASTSTPAAPKLITNARDDWEYSIGAAARYAFTPNLTADLSYACDLARNAQDNIANYQVREFSHQLVSLSVQFHF